MVLFYGWGSTASRLQALQGGSLLFTIQFPNISGTHFQFYQPQKEERLSQPWSHPVVFECETPGLGIQRLNHYQAIAHWSIPEKTGGLRTYLFKKKPWYFSFLYFTLEIPDKIQLHPWIFHKIALDPMEIPSLKMKTPGNSTLFFLGHPWKFPFVFNSVL